MAITLQVLIVGLAAGAGYGLVGMAYSLVYRLTGVVHFALGELTTLAIFATLWFAAGTGPEKPPAPALGVIRSWMSCFSM